MKSKHTVKLAVALVSIALSLVGCGDEPVADDSFSSAAPFEYSVGGLCELADYQSVRVDAYSLVWGLPGTGSRECPPQVREYLTQYLRKQRPQDNILEYRDLSAEQILSSLTTAVVRIVGVVPAGAPKGGLFDVTVTSLPATQTTSLQGGYLMPSDLRIITAGRRGAVAGRPLARAAGPIFINPFPSTKGKKADPRRGVIIGGGRTMYDRHIKLAILQPDHRTAQMIQQAINARFPTSGPPKTAQATRSLITLQIPKAENAPEYGGRHQPDYTTDYQHFVDLVLAVHLQNRPGQIEQRLREIDELLETSDADLETVALTWEAVGRNAIPHVKPYYQDTSTELAYLAARTAARLGEMSALDTLIRITAAKKHPARLRAAAALAKYPHDHRGRIALVNMLDDNNARLRMIAYRALREVADPAITSVPLPGGGALDIVQSKGPRFVSIWAQERPRIVLFGGQIACQPNIFFESSDGLVTLNAAPDAFEFAITRSFPEKADFITRKCPLTVADLTLTMALPLPKHGPDYARKSRAGGTRTADAPMGLGLTVSQIAGVLYELYQEKIIPAEFYLHRTERDLTD